MHIMCYNLIIFFSRWTPYVAPFPASHTGNNISLGLDAMVEGLGLDGDQWELFSVNDNAANVKLGIKLSRHLKQYLCDIHTLELGVKDTFKKVSGMKALLKKTKALAKFIHKSTVAASQLQRAAVKENVPYKKLENPPNTRWSGRHANLSSVLHLKKPIQKLTSSKESLTPHALSPGEWKLLEGSVKLLKPIRDTIKAWEAEKEPTMHRVVERLYSMHCILDDFIQNPTNNQYGVGFARELKKQIENRFPNKGTDNKFRRMANYLAPQFKGMHLELEDKLDTAKNYIKEEVNKIDMAHIQSPAEIQNPESNQVPEVTLSPNTKLRMRMKQRNHRLMTLNIDDLLSPLDREMKRYESFSIADKHINILKWWRDHESILPLLSKVAKKVLTIPASSSKSERIFSTGGNFVTKKRSRLAAKKVEDIILIKENKLQIQEFKDNGGYDIKMIDSKPFSMIEVDEVIANIVNDEIDSDMFASDSEEEEEEEDELEDDYDSDVCE